MTIFAAVVVYILVWWLALFCTLPIGIQNIDHAENGSMPGAPVNPGLKRKIVLTTIIATVVWLIICGVIKSDLISFRDIAARMAI